MPPRPVDLVTQLLGVLRSTVTLAGYAALLWHLGPWALVVLVFTGVPPFVSEMRHGRELFVLQRARTLRNRQGAYLETTLTTEATVKEVKLLGLSQWIIDRYHAVHEGFHQEEVSLHRRRARWSVALSVLSGSGSSACSTILSIISGTLGLSSWSERGRVLRSSPSNGSCPVSIS